MSETYSNYYRNELSYIDSDITDITTGQYYIISDLFPNITPQTVIGRLGIVTTPGNNASVAVEGEIYDYKNLGQVICRNFEGMQVIKTYITDTYMSLGWIRLQPIEEIKVHFKRNIPVKIINKLRTDVLDNMNQIGIEKSIRRELVSEYHTGVPTAHVNTYIYTGGFVTAPEGIGSWNISAPITDQLDIREISKTYYLDRTIGGFQIPEVDEFQTRMFTSDTVANVPWLYFPSVLKIGIRSIIPGNIYQVVLDRFILEENTGEF